MTRHRLPLLALVVAVLVAVVALVAHGRPLAASSGHGGLSPTFWSFAITTVVIVAALFTLGVIFVLFAGVPGGKKFTPPPLARAWMVVPAMAGLLVIGLLLRYLFHSGHGSRLHGHAGGHGETGKPRHSAGSGVHFRWEEVAVVLVLLLVAGMIVFVATRRRGRPRPGPLTAPEVVAAALDESLDDLRADPDLRRAIIAAYARMEKAFAVVGVPRRPAEAPLEYLERALLELDTSRRSVRRLTDLFEWAKFSQHEPEPSMRDEAVDALEAVRDELRAPAEVAA